MYGPNDFFAFKDENFSISLVVLMLQFCSHLVSILLVIVLPFPLCSLQFQAVHYITFFNFFYCFEICFRCFSTQSFPISNLVFLFLILKSNHNLTDFQSFYIFTTLFMFFHSLHFTLSLHYLCFSIHFPFIILHSYFSF